MDWNSAFFSKLKDKFVLVIGDVMIDRYLWGSVDRISPEAPVPVMLLDESENRLGGAANVAVNLSGLGCKAALIGCVGEDRGGQSMHAMGIAAEIDCRGMQSIRRWPTTTKTRVIAGSQHLLRVDDEAPLSLDADQEIQLKQAIKAAIDEKPDAIILQDYNKGVLSKSIIAFVLEMAVQNTIPVTVDPKAEHFFSYQNSTIFKPNLRELRAQVPFEISIDKASLKHACEYLREKLGQVMTCVTLSENGIFIESENTHDIYPTRQQHVVDVCGAGDAVISVLTLGLLCDISVASLAELSNISGGLVCEEVGVSPVPLSVLQQQLSLKSFY